MKLVTFRSGQETTDRVGALIEDHILEFTGAEDQPLYSSLLALIEAGAPAWDEARAALAERRGRLHARPSTALRAPLPLPPQYRDAMVFHKHILQSGRAMSVMRAKQLETPEALAEAEAAAKATEVPEIYKLQPFYYKGNRFAVGHPDQDIVWPAYSQVIDFELELACVIGKGGKNIARDDAFAHIFGFMILNDLSARDAQAPEMLARLGPAKGKDFDNANVFGPCLVTLDEIGDPYDLRMTARINGEQWTDGWSGDMGFNFHDLIAHISRGETLYPGEIIGSGTVGDGCGLEHMRFLKEGDVIELEIEKIGILRNRIIRS